MTPRRPSRPASRSTTARPSRSRPSTPSAASSKSVENQPTIEATTAEIAKTLGIDTMIIVKSPREIELMREACRITAGARTVARQAIAAGVTTREIDREVHKFILRSGATPYLSQLWRFSGKRLHLGERGSRTRHSRAQEGQQEATSSAWTWARRIHGFTGDCAGTYPCGEVSEEAKRLIEVTRQSFFEGIKFAQAGLPRLGHRPRDPGIC